MKYLLDANTFIEAKNRYYHMEICPGYWEWLLLQHQAGIVGSISMVQDELLKGSDELHDWANQHPDFFLEVGDDATQLAFAEVAEYCATYVETQGMKAVALDDFLGGADPWLIATAMSCSATLVTHEQYNPHTKRKLLIPNVCEAFEVNCMNTFELLHQLEARFILAR
jgi:hypothetical protein